MGRATRRLILSLSSLGLLLLAAAPQASAAGTLTTQRVGAATSSPAQDAAVRGPASLILSFDSTYSGTHPFTPKMTKATFNLDDDILITPGSTPQCDPTAGGFATSTTEVALALCPAAYLGAGAFEMTGPLDTTGISSAFNGTLSGGGLPRIILHLRAAAPVNATTILIVTLAPSVAGADFGQSLDMPIPIFPAGLVLEHLDFEIGEPGTPSASTYVTARCADASRVWNYEGAFVFDDASSRADTDSQPCAVLPPAAAPVLPATTPTKPKAKKKKKKKKKRRK